MADDLRLFGVTGDWKTAALDPGAWYNTVQEGGCRFMAAWVVVVSHIQRVGLWPRG